MLTLRIYRRYAEAQPNGWRSIREQTTDVVVQDPEQADELGRQAWAQYLRRTHEQAGVNFALFVDGEQS